MLDGEFWSISNFVAKLRKEGIKLWIEGEQLRVRAPRGTLDSDLRAALNDKKAEVVAYLHNQQAITEGTADYANRYAPFPLTDLQQSYWLGQTNAFELGNVCPHLYSEFEFADLDIERVRRVLRRLLERHDMLRSFVRPTGEQVVLESTPHWELPCVDLTPLDEDARMRAVDEVRDEMSRGFISTDTWPLFDVRAHCLPGDRIRFHISISLLIVDGSSMRILINEIRALYFQPDAILAPPSSLYRDYVLSLSTPRGRTGYRQQEQYWSERLATMAPAPDLPFSQDPGSIARPFLKRRSKRFDERTWAFFQENAQAAGIFRASALCAAYCTVLARWSKAPKFTLNILDSQRSTLQSTTHAVVGNYSTTTLTSIDASPAQTFTELGRQVQARRLADRQHGAVSGVRVLRELNRLQGTASHASMPVVFNSLDSVLEADEDLLSNEVFESLQTPQIILDHMVVARGRGLELRWDALEEVFPEGLLDAMFTAYHTLLERLSRDPSAWHLPLYALIAPPEAAHLTVRRGIRNARLCDDVWRAYELSPDRIAVRDASRTLTYRELLVSSRRVTDWLHGHSPEHRHLVAIVMDKGWEQIAAVLGIHEARAAYLPIDAQLPSERIRQLLVRGNIRLALTQPSVDPGIEWPPSVERWVFAEEDTLRSGDLPLRQLDPGGDGSDLAYVIFTSGSTGEPKGVMIDHRSALNTIDDINDRFGITESDRILAVSSLGFDLSVYDIFGLLGTGGSVVVPGSEDTRDPERLAAWLHNEDITIWNSVPAMMEMLVEYLESRDERLPASLRLVLLSGDWIPVTLPDRIQRLSRKASLVSLGGATEASIWSITYPINHVDAGWKSIPYGVPLANQRIDVLNAALERCPTWVAGELYIAGAGLALGYLGDPAQTAARFIHHPRSGERLYRTGDIGRYLPDGSIEFLGRDDFQVKINGFRIELGEIEAVLGRHPGVRSAVATVLHERTNAKQLAAYVVPKQDGLAPSELRSFLSEQLPAYMVPTRVTLLPKLPLTSNGKVDRKRLPEIEGVQPTVRTRSIEPTSAYEIELKSLWEEVLQHRPISVMDDFFEIGGNSLVAVRLSALVEQRLGRRMSISQLLQAPTIAGMAGVLEHEVNPTHACLVPIRHRTLRRALILVHPVGGNVVCYRRLRPLEVGSALAVEFDHVLRV